MLPHIVRRTSYRHLHRVASHASVPVLIAKRAQVDCNVRYFTANVATIRLPEDALSHMPNQEELPVGLFVAHRSHVGPSDYRSSAISNTSDTESMDKRLVLAIDLLDMICSRSCMMRFTLIILAMLLAPLRIGYMKCRVNEMMRKKRSGRYACGKTPGQEAIRKVRNRRH